MSVVVTIDLLTWLRIIHTLMILNYCRALASFVGVVASALGLSVAILSLRNPFIINLYYLRQSQLKISESRKNFLGKIGWILLGGLATLLFQWIGGLLRH
jgi:hypothetical protein